MRIHADMSIDLTTHCNYNYKWNNSTYQLFIVEYFRGCPVQ